MPEKLYICCEGCGEVFDEIVIAHRHPCGDHTFTIRPESEAF